MMEIMRTCIRETLFLFNDDNDGDGNAHADDDGDVGFNDDNGS